MLGRTITLFRLFGFAVRADATWIFIVVLIAWSLSVKVFPSMHPGLSADTYLAMGLAGTLALFLSIVLHEFAHAMVARRFGIPIKGITLFIFGGVAEMHEEPKSPRTELLMAAAGPAASLLISAIFLVLAYGGVWLGWSAQVVSVFQYLFWVNALLFAFNLVPAFPMDGGRILRALLWMWRGDPRSATKTASDAGSAFGMVLIGLGVFALVTGNFISGLWWFLIGMFIRSVAQSTWQQQLLKQFLEGVPISRFMTTEPVTVQRSIAVSELIEEYVYRYHHKMFPVLDGERLVGCVTTRAIRDLPREEWNRQTTGSIAEPCSDENTVEPDADAMKVLGRMSASGRSRLLVVDAGRLLGLITLKDLAGFLSVHMELGDDRGVKAAE
ncbi:MAG: site-2 protease family protein [Thermoanaerobaculia bacterium]|nr:site-2 protease family protein [Thermoanaerobaculia bacterium]